MKYLTLIRHAKSDHDHALLRDIDRPLSDRGRRDAPLLGMHLKATWLTPPDALFSSPAVRAKTTAEFVQREAALTALHLQLDDRIYEAPVDTLASVLRDIPDDIQHAVVFGHNPGLENLANWLCAQRVVYELRTGGVVMLKLNLTGWPEVQLGCAELLNYFYPAQIGGGKDAHAG